MNREKLIVIFATICIILFSACISSQQYQPKLPLWVLSPPSGGISASGSAQIGPSGLSFAKKKAEANARDELRRSLGVRIKNLIKNFTESSEIGDDRFIDYIFTSVSKQIATIDFSGAVTKKAYIFEETIYVLVALQPEVVSQVTNAVYSTGLAVYKKDKPLWQKLQAKSGQTALKNQINSEFGVKPVLVNVPEPTKRPVRKKRVYAKKKIVKKKSYSKPKKTVAARTNPKPSIAIISPVIKGREYSQSNKSILISGKINDATGVAEVLVNGKEAYLDGKGNFSINQLLRIGNNRIKITATNLDNIQSEKTFIVNRKKRQKPVMVQAEQAQTNSNYSNPRQWYKKQYALVVGVNKYKNQNIPRLYNAVNDANAIYTIFKEAGYEAILLQDEQATKKNITKSIRQFSKKVAKGDSFIFYFAGHGQGITLENEERVGYIVPYDSSIALNSNDPIEYDEEAISIGNLKKYSKNIKAKHVALLLDSCFAGLAMKRSIKYVKTYDFEYYNDLLSRKSINILTAGDDQPVSDGVRDHSQFTQALIDALNRKSIDMEDRDGFATFNELAIYVKNKVEKVTGRRQRPQFDNLSNDDGDFIFKIRHF